MEYLGDIIYDGSGLLAISATIDPPEELELRTLFILVIQKKKERKKKVERGKKNIFKVF